LDHMKKAKPAAKKTFTGGNKEPVLLRSTTTLGRAVHLLREEIFRHDDGAFLGLTEDLLKIAGVSRPTFRQATKLLEHEQLLLIRRGAGGGYFASLPSPDSVSQAAAIYFRAHQIAPTDLIHASKTINLEIVRLAIKGCNASTRGPLAEFLANDKPHEHISSSLEETIEMQKEFTRILTELGGNAPLALFIQSFLKFIVLVSAEAALFNHPERITTFAELRYQLGLAILSGNEKQAIDLASAMEETFLRWMSDFPAVEA